MNDNGKRNSSLEVALILVKYKDIYYKLVKILLGKYDKNGNFFIDLNGNKYNHLSTLDGHTYGYALRKTLKSVHDIYGGDTIRDSLRSYANEFRFSKFYFGASNDDLHKIYFVCEKNFSHFQFLFTDSDIEFSLNSFNAKKLSDAVKKKVIGQDEAIDDIVTVLWQNMHSKKKKNMMLIGPTGVGKTEIIRSISSELDIPVVVASASGLTKSGYKGESVEDVLLRLYKKSGCDITKAQSGIIVLDEFDKLASISSDTISTSGVQEELLKFVEGCEYDLNISNDSFYSEYIHINTEGITFIAMGAFADLDRQNRNIKSSSIGFGADVNVKHDENVFYNSISSDDLIKYGFIPELVGRLPVIIRLNSITKDVLIKILNNPDSDLLSDKINILNAVGVRLKINNLNLFNDEVASIALQKKIGVRGLNSVLESAFSSAMCEISQSGEKYDELIVDENIVRNPKKYVLTRKK